MNTRDYKQISESIFKFSKSMNLDYKELIQLHYEILFAVNTYFTAKSDAISTQIRRRLASIFEKKLGVSHEDVDVLLEGILTHTNIDVNDNANNIEILKELMQLVYLEENNGDAADHIEKLCGLFDNNIIYILGYLNKYLNVEEYKNAKSPVHDACLFNLPDISDGEWTPSLWAKLVNNNLNKPEDWSLIQRLLASAPSIEREYRKKASNAHRDFSKETPQTLHQYMLLYKRKTENVIAAVEFHKKGIDEDSFNDYLDLKPCDDHKLLPEVTIIDEDFTLSKLPAEDPRAAILGAYTGCCQSLGSHGEDCVRYGIEYPNAGFYIITNNKKNLQIVCPLSIDTG